MSVKLLYGEETYLLETKLKRIKKDFGELVKGINYIQLDETNVKELISDIETPAFGYENKLIIARNTELYGGIIDSINTRYISILMQLYQAF